MLKRYCPAAAAPLMGTGKSLGLQHGVEKKAVVPRASCFHNHTKEKRETRFFGSFVVFGREGHGKANRCLTVAAVRMHLEPANSSAAPSSSCLNNE